MEIGVKVFDSGREAKKFILLQGRVSNETRFISVETVPHRMGSTIIQNHRGKFNLKSVNGKPIFFYNYTILSLDKMKIAISGKFIRITDQSTTLCNDDDGSQINSINTDIVLDDQKFVYTLDTQSSEQIGKMSKIINAQRLRERLRRYIHRRVYKSIQETVADSSTITKVQSSDFIYILLFKF